MMGIKSYQERMFYNFSLSGKVPQDHLVRTLNEVLDLRFVRELVADKYSHTGQRSVDPEVLFKMMLIGYFYGITSERRLAEDISVNMAYIRSLRKIKPRLKQNIKMTIRRTLTINQNHVRDM